jgi:hypothetical protein
VTALEEMVFSKDSFPTEFWKPGLYNRIILALGSIVYKLSESDQYERSLHIVTQLHDLLGMHGIYIFVFLMVFNATFNNISVISWRSVLLVGETGENHRPVASHSQTLSHNVVHLALIEIRTHNISGDRH